MNTGDYIQMQDVIRHVAMTTGVGALKRTKYGAFVVYSRLPPDQLLELVQLVEPSIQSLQQLKTIFLLGPTPTFFGEARATTSWRREFLEAADKVEYFDARFMVVVPEPEDCNWKSVDYANLKGSFHVHGQLHWEDYFINLAAKTGILVLHAHFRWAGNAGPTARFEAGKLFALMKEDKVNACVLNYPADSETAQYIDAHLLDAEALYEKGRFEMVKSSPLVLSQENVPLDSEGNPLKAGVYPNGASEQAHLQAFFLAITEMALTIAK